LKAEPTVQREIDLECGQKMETYGGRMTESKAGKKVRRVPC
jgi:hypothetical protein